jgi:cell division protein FtsA
MVRKKSRENICVLDIGSSKIVCFIASIGSHGSIEITGIGHNLSGGIKSGSITDVKASEMAIAQAVEAAERMAGERIDKIYVNISAVNSLVKQINSQIIVAGHEITEKDLQKLLIQLSDNQPKDFEIIHSFPLDYSLDGNQGITSPLRMYGKELHCKYNIVMAAVSTILNLENCLTRCQLEMESLIHSTYSAGLASLTNDEKDMGTILLEMGGGSTSIAVFNNGSMIFADAVPFGGIHITNDLAKILSIDFANAERLKTLYGSAITSSADKEQFFDLTLENSEDDNEDNKVSKDVLVEIISARVEEILEMLKHRLTKSNAEKFAGNKIVITGGASQLQGMKEMVAKVFERKVQGSSFTAAKQNLHGLADSASGPSFAVPIGMLMYVADLNENDSVVSATSKPWQGLLNWFKENFA